MRYHRQETQLEEDRLYLYGGVGTKTEEIVYLDLLRRTWVVARAIGEQAMPLLGHTAAQVGSSLYVVGGRDARQSYNTIWKLDTLTHEWSKPLPMGTQPPPCSKHAMVVQGTRLIVALGEIARNRVFIYDTVAASWLQAEVAEDTPAPALSRTVGVQIGNEFTVFGGMDEETRAASNEIHVLDLPTMSWHPLQPGGFVPQSRVGTAACSLGVSMYIFGGIDATGYTSTFAAYDASAMVWESPQLDGTAPGARVGQTMVTAANGFVYMFGGASGGRPLSDVFVLDLARSGWDKLHVKDVSAMGPPPKVGHACIYVNITTQGQLAKDNFEYVGEKLLVFGGGDGRKATNETYLIDVTPTGDGAPSLATVQLQTRGRPPQERVGHAMALVRNSLVYVFGGFVRKLGYMFDVHCLDLARVEWNQIKVGGTVPDERINHTLCTVGRTLYLFGGAFKGNAFGEVYTLSTHDKDAHRWERLQTTGLTPEPRSSHSAEMIRHNMFVFGGVHGAAALGDLIVLDTRTSVWFRPRTSAPPRPRGNHSAAAVGDRLIIFGGSTGGTFFRDCPCSTPPRVRSRRPCPHPGPRASGRGEAAAADKAAADRATAQLSAVPPWRLVRRRAAPGGFRRRRRAAGPGPGENKVTFGGASGSRACSSRAPARPGIPRARLVALSSASSGAAGADAAAGDLTLASAAQAEAMATPWAAAAARTRQPFNSCAPRGGAADALDVAMLHLGEGDAAPPNCAICSSRRRPSGWRGSDGRRRPRRAPRWPSPSPRTPRPSATGRRCSGCRPPTVTRAS